MESILQMAQNATINPFGNLVQDFQGAQTNAINNQRGRMQNTLMGQEVNAMQKLLGIAPQLAEAVRGSNIPNKEVLAQIVEADPTKAMSILSQGTNASLLSFQDDLAQRKIAGELLERVKPQLEQMRIAEQILINPNSSEDQISQATRAYMSAENEIDDDFDIALASGMKEKYLTRPKAFAEVMLTAEKAGMDRKKLDIALAQEKRDSSLFPYRKNQIIAQTQLAQAQAGDIGRQQEAEILGDMDKYTSVMDTMASTADALANSLRDLRSGDRNRVLQAKADITKRVSRASSNEALSEADFARAAGAENWQMALDNFLKTNFAQMSDAQAIDATNRLYSSSREAYNLAKQRAEQVSGGRKIIAKAFPALGGEAPTQSKSSAGGSSGASKSSGAKKSVKELPRF